MATTFNQWASLGDAIEQGAIRQTKRVAVVLQGHIRQHIIDNGQVDTGFLRDSVYHVTKEESTYEGGEDALPELEHPPDETTALVSVAAHYAGDQNYGTRYLPPRPFFEPALEQTRNEMDVAMMRIADDIRKVARP